MNFLPGLVSIAGSVLGRVLLALGFAVVTVTGVAMSIDTVKAKIIGNISGAPSAWVQLAGLYGAWEGLGIVFGACTFALTYWTITRSVSILGLNGTG